MDFQRLKDLAIMRAEEWLDVNQVATKTLFNVDRFDFTGAS